MVRRKSIGIVGGHEHDLDGGDGCEFYAAAEEGRGEAQVRLVANTLHRVWVAVVGAEESMSPPYHSKGPVPRRQSRRMTARSRRSQGLAQSQLSPAVEVEEAGG